MPGSSLLSHGETPHYHRRYGVSLLSSAWGQVGPPRYRRQANSLYSVLCLLHRYCVGCSCERQSHTHVCSFRRCLCRLVSAQNPSDSESELKIFSNPPKHLRRCKVKPHGSLVPVSSTHRCAYTPGLSTSSSSTFLQDSQGVRENSSRGKFRA